MIIQSELNVPKSQRNNFGNYNYRSCEDILEAVKPHLAKTKTTLTLSDSMVLVGDRIYVEATANLSSEEATVSVTAYAREAETQKGMSDSQITGSASSYARKYALNGLFCIDDTKDADSTNTYDKEEPKKSYAKPSGLEAKKNKMIKLAKGKLNLNDVVKKYGVKVLGQLTEEQIDGTIKTLEATT